MEAHSLTRPSGGLTVPKSRKLLAAFGDERLVEQLRRGNDVAFEVLYDRHHKGVLSYCRHMLGNRDEAEDALQQAFISAHADIISSEKPIRFKAWIYTIARNRCLSILRARREQPSEDLEVVSTAGLSDEVQQRADLQQLLVDMQELPEDQRQALILSELGDLSHSDVAEVIGCEASKVKSLVFQARAGLIERRQARETPCEEIREQLATLRGGSLRRGPLRRHLKECPGCTQFREDVRRQRQMVAAILPVVPTLGLKESALAAVGMGAASTGGGIIVGGGAGAAVVAKAGVAKIAIVALATGGAVGGGVAIDRSSDGPPRSGSIEQAAPAVGGASGPGTLEVPAQAPTSDQAVAKDRAGIPGHDEDAKATDDAKRKDDAKGRDGDARAKGEGRRGEESRGFQPEKGTSNGERARDFARERGKGRKRGLVKQEARAGAGKARGRNGDVRRGPRPKRSRPERSGAGQARGQGQGQGQGNGGRPQGPLTGPPAVAPGLQTTPPRTGFPQRSTLRQQRLEAAQAKRDRALAETAG